MSLPHNRVHHSGPMQHITVSSWEPAAEVTGEAPALPGGPGSEGNPILGRIMLSEIARAERPDMAEHGTDQTPIRLSPDGLECLGAMIGGDARLARTIPSQGSAARGHGGTRGPRK